MQRAWFRGAFAVGEATLFLEEILDSTRRSSAQRASKRSLRAVERAARDAEPPRGLARALLGAAGDIALIAEIKKASPSAGVLRPGLNVQDLAGSYARAGADALSVLTEAAHFQGQLEDLARTEHVPLPRLQKDFLLSEYQVLEGRAGGADAVLVIAEALSASRAADLCRLALELGMDVLYEAHDPANIRRVATHAERAPERILVGINNRDLHTFHVSLDVSLHALRELPRGLQVVSESGIRTPDDVVRLRAAGARAILVGESLVRAADPEAATRELLSSVRTRDGAAP